jgi:hypothetical protein
MTLFQLTTDIINTTNTVLTDLLLKYAIYSATVREINNIQAILTNSEVI